MSKNTRWALAIVGVVIIIVGAFVIGTGKDNTDATQAPSEQPTPQTGPTETKPVTPQTGSTGADTGGDTGTDDNGGGSGGASPDDSGQSGGASPDESGNSGGAQAEIGVISPVLTEGGSKTITVKKGDTVTVRGRSTSGGEMHIHGYDNEVELKPGKIGRAKFKATIDGEFHIEFHLPSGEVQVGILRVNP